VKAIHVECDSACQFDVKIALSRIYASSKNEDYPNGIRLRLVPEINSMISPETRQNVTRLRARQDNFQKQIGNAISWDIMALDFVDSTLQRSLRDLIMKIESRTVRGQPLFHSVEETWNQNGYFFSFFPNVDTEARAMMMSYPFPSTSLPRSDHKMVLADGSEPRRRCRVGLAPGAKISL
jgi:hypothetical protein